jgi:hypothetical protein
MKGFALPAVLELWHSRLIQYQAFSRSSTSTVLYVAAMTLLNEGLVVAFGAIPAVPSFAFAAQMIQDALSAALLMMSTILLTLMGLSSHGAKLSLS